MTGKLPPPLPAAASEKRSRSNFWPVVIVIVAAWLIAGHMMDGGSLANDINGAFAGSLYQSEGQ
jgi:hypothetical protein